MMKNKRIKVIVIITPVFLLCFLSVSAQYQIDACVLGSGGGTASDGSNTISGTLGQPLAGTGDFQTGFWYAKDIVVSCMEADELIPIRYRLEQNFPNPFNPVTTIQFTVPKTATVRLILFDMLGRQVATLLDQEMKAGSHEVILDASDLTSGLYFYGIQAGEFTQVRKSMLVK